MLLIETYLDKSPIEGVGVFSKEFVKKGALLWEFNSIIDIMLTIKQVDQLPKIMREFVENHGYPYVEDELYYCLSFDNARYLNHSSDPSISTSDPTVALKDIQKHEELTIDYMTI